MSIRILEQSVNSLVYELPHGKPNPNEGFCIDQDDRDRVRQKAQTTSACQYYVLNYLRLRIGKHPGKNLIQEREIEKICSLRRKAVSVTDGTMIKILEDIHGIKTLEGNTTLEEKKQVIQFFKEHSHWETNWETNTNKDVLRLMSEEKYKKRIQINTEFFEGLKVNIKEMFASEITFENGYTDTWNDFEQLDTQKKSTVLNNFAFKVMAEKYGLKKSIWTPLDNIESLISELGKNGPLAISGIFGRVAYLDPPFRLSQKIDNREIYAWKPGAKRKPASDFSAAHACLIVGAKKIDAKEYVYFIDPQDPSDPKDESSQRIYLGSYKNFMSHTIDLHGRACFKELASDAIAQAPTRSKAGYAYYGYKLFY